MKTCRPIAEKAENRVAGCAALALLGTHPPVDPGNNSEVGRSTQGLGNLFALLFASRQLSGVLTRAYYHHDEVVDSFFFHRRFF